MRNIGPILIVALMLMVGLAGFLLWGPLSEKPGMRETPEEASKSPAEREQEKAKLPPIQMVEPLVTTRPARRATAALVPPVQAAPVEPRHFPVASEIPLGTDKINLQKSFGKPMMKTTAVEAGRLLETWVYLQTDPDTATFVLIRNGRVVSSNTTVY